MNGGVSKKIIAAFVAMGLLIIVLASMLIITNFFNKEVSTETDSKPVTKKASEEDESSKEESEEEESEDEPEEEEDSEEESEKDEDKESDEKDEGFILNWTSGNSWDEGSKKMCGLDMTVTNKSGEAVNGWTLELEVEQLKSCDGWNGEFDIDGDTLIIKNVDYNGNVQNGSSVNCGCNIGTGVGLDIKSAKFNGVECTIKKGKVSKKDNNGSGDKKKDVDVDKLLARCDDAKQGDDWLHTDGNKILDADGKQVWLTGVNWFGYNTGTNTFDGLWNSELVPTVEAIADHGFNLIRVPISAELINQWADGEYPQANYNNAYNEELNSMNSLEIFDYFLKLAEENGIKVMPDIHSAETDAAGHNANLWYTDRISVKEYYAALEWMAERYKDNDTIIAFDLKNEPHGKPDEGDKAAIWNDSKDDNNWKYVAETAAAKVLAKNPNVLIMVEGTEIYPKNIKKNGDYSSQDSEDYYFNWWGGNLRGVHDYPVDLGKYQDKLVYSPHDYGPTVYEQPWFEGDYDFKSLKEDCWQDNWLYINDEKIAPLLIGEWGGYMTEPNITWMTHLRTLIKTYKLNHTFWCFNSNSGDTGGLVLDDFTTWDEEKYNFVKEVLWQQNGKFVGLDHEIPLGTAGNGISLSDVK